MTRIKILEICASVLLIVVVVALLYVWMASPLGTSDKVGITMAISTVALVIVTSIYAWHTRKMTEEVREQRYDAVRPVIDIKRDTARADIERRTLEAYAASSEDASHGLLCILHNIGLGPAIDVRSFIQTPTPTHERQPWEFGTLASGGKTERMILSITHEDNRMALLAYYEDIYGRTFESSREVSVDKEKGWEIGPLKIVPVKEGNSHD